MKVDKKLFPWLAAACLLQSACVVVGPDVKYETKDPFGAFGTNPQTAKAFPNLRLGVIFTQNTLVSIKTLADTQALSRRKSETINHDVINEIDPQSFTDGLSHALIARFKEVDVVGSPDEARKQGCDLVVALDIQIHLTQTAPGATTVAIAGAFSDIDGNALDTIAGSGIKKLGAFSKGTIGFADAWGQARDAFTRSLDQSSNLLNLAKSKTPDSAIQAGPFASKGAAAAPRTIHSDVDHPRYRAAENPEYFAVVVGIEKYANDLPDAQFAERDAAAVKAHLVALGYPERNIKLLTGQRASYSALAAHLEDWLPRMVNENSKVFFYFSGHGAPNPKSGQAYLVPFDGNPNYLDKTAYPVKKLYADLSALKAKGVVVALDSCFSGAGGRSVMAEGARPLVTRVDTAVAPGGKIALFAAASSDEITSTLKEQGHGIFTYYFLKGLDDAAAKNASGGLSAQGLYKYLKPKVQDEASRQNRDQTPTLQGLTTQEITRFERK